MNRKHWHEMLDRAMDQTHEGEFFLPEFVRLVMRDLLTTTSSLASHVPASGDGQLFEIAPGGRLNRRSHK